MGLQPAGRWVARGRSRLRDADPWEGVLARDRARLLLRGRGAALPRDLLGAGLAAVEAAGARPAGGRLPWLRLGVRLNGRPGGDRAPDAERNVWGVQLL